MNVKKIVIGGAAGAVLLVPDNPAAEVLDAKGFAALPADLVAQILQKGCESRATDIHVDPHEQHDDRDLRCRQATATSCCAMSER